MIKYFSLRAMDYTDAEALDRRMAAREAHFAFLKPIVDQGKAFIGGALLDESGKMIGSTIIFQMTQEEFDTYLKEEPYITEKVWEKLEINECKIGPAFMEKYFSAVLVS